MIVWWNDVIGPKIAIAKQLHQGNHRRVVCTATKDFAVARFERLFRQQPARHKASGHLSSSTARLGKIGGIWMTRFFGTLIMWIKQYHQMLQIQLPDISWCFSHQSWRAVRLNVYIRNHTGTFRSSCLCRGLFRAQRCQMYQSDPSDPPDLIKLETKTSASAQKNDMLTSFWTLVNQTLKVKHNGCCCNNCRPNAKKSLNARVRKVRHDYFVLKIALRNQLKLHDSSGQNILHVFEATKT